MGLNTKGVNLSPLLSTHFCKIPLQPFSQLTGDLHRCTDWFQIFYVLLDVEVWLIDWLIDWTVICAIKETVKEWIPKKFHKICNWLVQSNNEQQPTLTESVFGEGGGFKLTHSWIPYVVVLMSSKRFETKLFQTPTYFIKWACVNQLKTVSQESYASLFIEGGLNLILSSVMESQYVSPFRCHLTICFN